MKDVAVILVGDIFGGYCIVGPFGSMDEAAEYADAHVAGPNLIAHLDAPTCDAHAPTCDICGRVQGDPPYSLDADAPADWNGETGNHVMCETTAQ